LRLARFLQFFSVTSFSELLTINYFVQLSKSEMFQISYVPLKYFQLAPARKFQLVHSPDLLVRQVCQLLVKSLPRKCFSRKINLNNITHVLPCTNQNSICTKEAYKTHLKKFFIHEKLYKSNTEIGLPVVR
jgi:hypothetical protein